MRAKTMTILGILVASAVSAAPVRSNISCEGAEDENNWEPTASDYIQDGLVSMLDAIENSGLGEHDSLSKTWVNLVPGGTTVSSQGFYFGEDYLTVSTTLYSISLSTSERETFEAGDDFTVEFLVEAGDSTWNTPFLLYTSGLSTFVSFYNIPKRAWYGQTLLAPQGGNNQTVGETILLTFIREGNFGRLYIDGAFCTEKKVDNLISCDKMYFYATAHKQKAIRFYDRALNESEIKYNYLVDRIRFNLP